MSKPVISGFVQEGRPLSTCLKLSSFRLPLSRVVTALFSSSRLVSSTWVMPGRSLFCRQQEGTQVESGGKQQNKKPCPPPCRDVHSVQQFLDLGIFIFANIWVLTFGVSYVWKLRVKNLVSWVCTCNVLHSLLWVSLYFCRKWRSVPAYWGRLLNVKTKCESVKKQNCTGTEECSVNRCPLKRVITIL
jgi:hypothetical protein